MLSTKALLNPFNSIFAKVHHPPPLDKRESQRLLKALTVSFRTHLTENMASCPKTHRLQHHAPSSPLHLLPPPMMPLTDDPRIAMSEPS